MLLGEDLKSGWDEFQWQRISTSVEWKFSQWPIFLQKWTVKLCLVWENLEEFWQNIQNSVTLFSTSALQLRTGNIPKSAFWFARPINYWKKRSFRLSKLSLQIKGCSTRSSSAVVPTTVLCITAFSLGSPDPVTITNCLHLFTLPILYRLKTRRSTLAHSPLVVWPKVLLANDGYGEIVSIVLLDWQWGLRFQIKERPSTDVKD